MSFLNRFRSTTDTRVVILGLAGVPYSIITDDSYPNLAAVMQDGVATRSVLPPDEHAVWPAVMAGRNPGHTGVFGLIDREIGSYQTYIPQGGDVQVPRLWDLAESAGNDSTVLNVPGTNPPQKEIGRMVAGPLAPDVARSAHPEATRAYLDASEYRIDVDADLGATGDLEDLLIDAKATVAARFDAFEQFLTEDDWTLFIGCVTAIDRASHFLYDTYTTDDNDTPLHQLYAALDDHVGAFLDTVPDDVCVCVVGDHGFAPLEHELHCNRWLHDHDWLDYDDADADSLEDIAPSTQAFALPQGRFYLNLEGREPAGTVPDQDYESVRAELRTSLESITTPAGDPVIQAVHAREELYDGPHVELAPDLVAVPHPGYDLVANFTGPGTPFSDSDRTGMHTTTDVPLAINHPEVTLDAGTPFDLTPTVLDILDIDIPTELSGTSKLDPSPQ